MATPAAGEAWEGRSILRRAVTAAPVRPIDRHVHAVAGWTRGAGALIRRHWLFSTFVLLAVAIRVVASIAYWPGLEFWADSYDYLRLAHALIPGTWHPSGYPLLLALLSLTGQLGVVTVVQHAMGIGSGVLVYALALRLCRRRWLAAIAALPILLDGYQLDLEQLIMAETLTDLLLLAGLVVVLWREEVSAWRGAVAALLLAASTLTRSEILPVMVVVGLYLLLRAGRWRGLVAYCAVAGAMLVGYGGWYAAENGHFGYSDVTGRLVYGRVAPFATCHYALPGKEGALCPMQPVSRRTQNSEYFADSSHSPINQRGLGNQRQRYALATRFAINVIEHQPLSYAKAVLSDTWHYFTPGRWMTSDRIDLRRWQFPRSQFNPKADQFHLHFANVGFGRGFIQPSPDAALMGPLRTYQSVVYMPGPAFLACLGVALAAGLGLVRRRTTSRHPRWAALVLAVSAVVVVLIASLSTGFSYRYGLPLLVLLPPAGAAGVGIGLDWLAGVRRLRSYGAQSGLGIQPRDTWMRRSTESMDYRT